jgi:nitrite reductase/ring-hydroxylating ferredoxin subunit
MNPTQLNGVLTQTGPEQPMGKLFRRYWIPALLASELPQPDCAPVRVKLLSEKLLAFRDSSGKLGLIDEFCAHRGVSLWFGRNEDNGIRCPYHGWKYDVTGQCVQVPSEPSASTYCNKVKLTSYPLVERGGILWTYMGPAELQPELPAYEFVTVAPTQHYFSKRFQFCNFLQAMEGGIDPHHVAFLHSGEMNTEAMIANESSTKYVRPEIHVRMEAAPTDGGLLLAYGRDGDDSRSYWRVMQWLLPFCTIIPPFGSHPVHGHFWVPIDDENCWAWTFDYHGARDLTQEELVAAREGRGLHVPVDPHSFMPLANKDNDYFIDREKQRAGLHYSGVPSIGMQDASLQESMGAVQDRTKEHLVACDRFIVMARRMLSETALRHREDPSMTLPGLSPDSQRVRSATVMLPTSANVFERVKEAVKVRSGEPFTSE